MEDERDRYVNEQDWPRLPQPAQHERQNQEPNRQSQPTRITQRPLEQLVREEPHQGTQTLIETTNRPRGPQQKGTPDYTLPPPLNTSQNKRRPKPAQHTRPADFIQQHQRRTSGKNNSNTTSNQRKNGMDDYLNEGRTNRREPTNRSYTQNIRDNQKEGTHNQIEITKGGNEKTTKTTAGKENEDDWWTSNDNQAQNVQFGFFSRDAGKNEKKEEKEENSDGEESIYY